MKKESLRDAVSRLESQNHRFVVLLNRVRILARAGNLKVNRMAIIREIDVCLSEYFGGPDLESMMARDGLLPMLTDESPNDEVELGVIEFHSERLNPGLIKRFYAVKNDLNDAACIVDTWLMDIAAVLTEFGYEMRVFRGPEAQRRYSENKPSKEPAGILSQTSGKPGPAERK